MGTMYADVTEWQQGNARHVLEQALKTVQAYVPESQLPDVYTEALNSSVVPTLVNASENKQMVVIGSRGTGALGRLLLGSVSTALVHHASCPVAVIRPEPAPSDSEAPVLLRGDCSLVTAQRKSVLLCPADPRALRNILRGFAHAVGMVHCREAWIDEPPAQRRILQVHTA